MLNKLVPAGPTLVLAASVLLPLLDAASARAAGLSWQASAGHRAAPVAVTPSAGPGFTLLAGDKTGIHFTNTLSYDRSVATISQRGLPDPHAIQSLSSAQKARHTA